MFIFFFFFFSSRRRHTRSLCDWSSDVCSSDLFEQRRGARSGRQQRQRPRLRLPESRAREDRKSTRLNSSHTVISYAVFCLKKKKETDNKRTTDRRITVA